MQLDERRWQKKKTNQQCCNSCLAESAFVRPKRRMLSNKTGQGKNTRKTLKQSFDFIDEKLNLIREKPPQPYQNVNLRKYPPTCGPGVDSACAALLQDLHGFCEAQSGATWAGFNESWRRIINNSYIQLCVQILISSGCLHAEFGRGATTECRDSVGEWRRKSGLLVSLLKNMLT